MVRAEVLGYPRDAGVAVSFGRVAVCVCDMRFYAQRTDEGRAAAATAAHSGPSVHRSRMVGHVEVRVGWRTMSEITLPILRNHDSTNVIGKVTAGNHCLIVEFLPDAAVTVEMALAAFGSFRVIEEDHIGGQRILRKAEVFAFSVERNGSGR